MRGCISGIDMKVYVKVKADDDKNVIKKDELDNLLRVLNKPELPIIFVRIEDEVQV